MGKIKSALAGTMVMCENEQKACKKIGNIHLLFLPMNSKYYTLVGQSMV